ncbi:hypothetical protein FBU30_000887 [Linnemannia zychae]|nr:hypothetical protein FBU30_000887 [Linnemannia zychae]
MAVEIVQQQRPKAVDIVQQRSKNTVYQLSHKIKHTTPLVLRIHGPGIDGFVSKEIKVEWAENEYVQEVRARVVEQVAEAKDPGKVELRFILSQEVFVDYSQYLTQSRRWPYPGMDVTIDSKFFIQPLNDQHLLINFTEQILYWS